ncbi:MAG: glycosyltransferase [Proteobacteria bacterium]|nr:glycosyltransferase [Pseudomonadota bacterium]MBU1738864.1 glycosyltransferase [Pseudomonadota bacterium]
MKKKLCILLKSLPTGGVEKMMLNLAEGVAERNYQVEIVLFECTGSHIASIPESVNLLGLMPEGKKRGVRKLFAVAKAFRQYVRKNRPDVVISAKEQANLVNVLFRLLCRNSYRSVITRHVPLDGGLVGTDAKPFVIWLYRHILWRADRIVAVSEGIAGEIRSMIPAHAADHVSVICNPVIDSSVFEKASQTLDEQWLEDKKVPLMVASGRLSHQKGFDILLEAVSILREKMVVKLLILGEGEMRERLMDDISRLSLEEDVRLVGFKVNPYPYYKNADVFVMSSRWEGQPLALIEALAMGTRVVSTDCRTGPREILQGGRLGVLVPSEDPRALAEGIEAALRNPANKNLLNMHSETHSPQLAAESFNETEHNIQQYTIPAASAEYDKLFCRLLGVSD